MPKAIEADGLPVLAVSGAPMGLGKLGAAATLVALNGGQADAVVGALLVVGLLALARKLIRLAGDPAPDESDRPPVSPE
jgi:hypothetical protein